MVALFDLKEAIIIIYQCECASVCLSVTIILKSCFFHIWPSQYYLKKKLNDKLYLCRTVHVLYPPPKKTYCLVFGDLVELCLVGLTYRTLAALPN